MYIYCGEHVYIYTQKAIMYGNIFENICTTIISSVPEFIS